MGSHLLKGVPRVDDAPRIMSKQSQPLHRVICVSRSRVPLTDEVLLKIQDVASTNNEKADVGGMLLIGGGYFMQVLEGERGAIQNTVSRNCVDVRHEMVPIVRSEPIASRSFETGSVGVINYESPGEDFDLFDMVDVVDQAGRDVQSSERAGRMMRAFESAVDRLQAA